MDTLLHTSRRGFLQTCGRRAGEITAASELPVPDAPSLKDPKAFRLLGKPTKRLDSPAEVDGSAKYGIDAILPGMLVAVMARAPLPGAKPARVDDLRDAAATSTQTLEARYAPCSPSSDAAALKRA